MIVGKKGREVRKWESEGVRDLRRGVGDCVKCGEIIAIVCLNRSNLWFKKEAN